MRCTASILTVTAPMEPPDDYYFAPDREPKEEELTDDE